MVAIVTILRIYAIFPPKRPLTIKASQIRKQENALLYIIFVLLWSSSTSTRLYLRLDRELMLERKADQPIATKLRKSSW
jgi:hypothetical protein